MQFKMHNAASATYSRHMRVKVSNMQDLTYLIVDINRFTRCTRKQRLVDKSFEKTARTPETLKVFLKLVPESFDCRRNHGSTLPMTYWIFGRRTEDWISREKRGNEKTPSGH